MSIYLCISYHNTDKNVAMSGFLSDIVQHILSEITRAWEVPHPRKSLTERFFRVLCCLVVIEGCSKSFWSSLYLNKRTVRYPSITQSYPVIFHHVPKCILLKVFFNLFLTFLIIRNFTTSTHLWQLQKTTFNRSLKWPAVVFNESLSSVS